MRTHTPTPTENYLNATFACEDDAMRTARLCGDALRAGMQLSPYEGALLAWLARCVQAQHILEIGSFVGYSTLWLARTLPENGTLITIEKDAQHAALTRTHLDHSDYGTKCEVRIGDALEQVQHLTSHSFDLIFIDAAKGDYHALLEATDPMLRIGGMVIGDNSLLFGHMAGAPSQRASKRAIESMRAFNTTLATSEKYDAMLLPTPEGLTIGIKRA
ncbi:MAG: O-methyltransferase [Alphaproteobacteria bacterium]|nr:MAG: O-methyltransferase [Alphaproteobacteria bacterium]